MAFVDRRRRTVLQGLLLAATPAAFAAAVSSKPERTASLLRGESALMRGDAESALQAFEQAGALGHDPAIELGMVRSAMQAGRYGQALSFAAHTAGEHPQDAACVATYLWLLRLGGHDDFARQLWASASQFMWTDADRALLQSVHDAWAGDWPQAGGALRQTPLRLAPYAHGQDLPSDARLVATGTLVRDPQGAQQVLLPREVLTARAGQRWWVRNGLGRTVRAQWDAARSEGPLGVLRLETPMPGPALLASRDAFPGSPAYAFAYALGPLPDTAPSTGSEAALALAAWPSMKMGFAGAMQAPSERLLGVEVHAGTNPLGGPVLDAQGRLTGVSLATAGTSPERLVPASFLVQRGWSSIAPASERSGERQSSDALYEQGLTSALQIIQAQDV